MKISFLFAYLLVLISQNGFAASPESVYQRASPSVVYVVGLGEKFSSQGSGVIVAPNIIATNCHVIKSVKAITVLSASQKSSAVAVYADLKRDVCLLSAGIAGGVPARLGSATALKVGQRVYAIGAPRGLALSLSDGIVSSLRGDSSSQMVQTTAQISPGSSGGGLFDDEGRLVGLTTYRIKDSEGLNFSLPVNWVAEALTRLQKKEPLGIAANSNSQGEESPAMLAMMTAATLLGGNCPFDKPPELSWKTKDSRDKYEIWAAPINLEILRLMALQNGQPESWRSESSNSASDPARSLYYESFRAGLSPNIGAALAIKFASRSRSRLARTEGLSLMLPISTPTLEAIKIGITARRDGFCWDPYAFRINVRIAMNTLRGYLDQHQGDLKEALFDYASLDAELQPEIAKSLASEVMDLYLQMDKQTPAPSISNQ